MSSEKFCLRWNDFESNISTAFRELRDDKDFFDVTLACDDEQIQAHKVILSACSPFFRNVLRRNPHQHPLLYLKSVKYTDLQAVLNFMYHGEVNVAQEELNSFLAVAEDLRVKGLTQNQAGNSSRQKESQEVVRNRPVEREPLPPKKPRPTAPPPSFTQDDDDIQEVVPVKTEPREHIPTASPAEMYHESSPVVQQTSSVPQANTSQQSHQLQQLDDSLQYAGDESYDDYGQYGVEGGYEAGLMDPSMGAQDASKGSLQDPKEMDQYIVRSNGKDYLCVLCNQFTHHSRHSVRNHVESKHFPNTFSYPCHECGKMSTTRKAYENHIQKHRQSLKQHHMNVSI